MQSSSETKIEAEQATAQQGGEQMAEHETIDSEAAISDLEAAAADFADAEASEEIDLAAELAEMKEKWLRAVAECENIRKRAERDQGETRKYAISSFARDMTSVCENLHRALDSMPLDALDEAENQVLKTLHTGVEMTRSELLKTFEQHGITRILPQRGELFDHNLHQAVSQMEDPSLADGQIAHVIQAGYQLKERLLQPAMVAVVKGSKPAAPQVDTSA